MGWRDKFSRWIFNRAGLVAGDRLPAWAIAVKCLLHPVDAVGWYASRHVGFDWQTMTWHIAGARWSQTGLHTLANSDGVPVQVHRVGDRVEITLRPDLMGGEALPIQRP